MWTIPPNSAALSVLDEAGEELISSMNKRHGTRKFPHDEKETSMEGFTLHLRRHTLAMHLVSVGEDICAARRLVGHLDVRACAKPKRVWRLLVMR
jgi:site-specific recombinase XerD